MHQAVKRVAGEVATDLSDQELIPNNDVTGTQTNRNIAALRQKIKSARLEKLMARQLETELSIDHIEIEEPEDFRFAPDDNQSLEDIKSTLRADPFEGLHEADDTYSSHPSSKIRSIDLHQSLRHCGEMLEKIKFSAQALTDLSSHANGLEAFLRTVEQDLVALE